MMVNQNVVPLDPKWKSLLNQEWLDRLDGTEFLAACRTGRVSRPALRSFVRQQFFYARHFTQYLCALLSNLEQEEDRQALAQNLFEEMGLGGLGDVPHSLIYR